MSGQKWLCGPGGTGALYVARDRFADIKPTYARACAAEATGFLMPPPNAARYELGEFYGPAVLGQLAGLTWLQDEIGFPWIYDRIAELGKRCWDGLRRTEGVTVITPRDAMAGLICFEIEGLHPRELTNLLEERGHTIRYVEYQPGPTVARISTGWWCTEEEVDEVVTAIGDIAANPPARPD
jgi:L-cysteine/cystine lyase